MKKILFSVETPTLLFFIGLTNLSQSGIVAETATAVETTVTQQARAYRELGQTIDVNSGFSTENCAPRLQDLEKQLHQLDVRKVDALDASVFYRDLVIPLWSLRHLVRARLTDLYRKHQLQANCVTPALHLLYVIQSIEDHWISHEASRTHGGSWNGSKALPMAPQLPVSGTLINPAYQAQFGTGPVNLRSGDILISRGTASSSAMIAKLGTVDGSFSHMALVYIDPITKQAYTIEAHIEVGVVVAPFQKYFTDGKVRSALYRHTDPVLAAKAAQWMYLRAKTAMHHGNIPYDFQMNANLHQELYCTEVIREGFEVASGKKEQIPLFFSAIEHRNPAFLNRLGIHEKQAFLPIDIQVDPRFTWIAEWRDGSAMLMLRKHDAIIAALFEWMNENNYVFHNSIGLRAKTEFAYTLRRTPWANEYVRERFPLNMTKSVLITSFLLDEVFEKVLSELERIEHTWLQLYGRPMSTEDLLWSLDGIRRKELRIWKNPENYSLKRSDLFHWYFRPMDLH